MAYVSACAHPSFPQPDDGSVKVWRYLDLARLISLLMSKKLRLTRVDLLKDDYEGSVTRGLIEKWKNSQAAAVFTKSRVDMRKRTYIS